MTLPVAVVRAPLWRRVFARLSLWWTPPEPPRCAHCGLVFDEFRRDYSGLNSTWDRSTCAGRDSVRNRGVVWVRCNQREYHLS